MLFFQSCLCAEVGMVAKNDCQIKSFFIRGTVTFSYLNGVLYILKK